MLACVYISREISNKGGASPLNNNNNSASFGRFSKASLSSPPTLSSRQSTHHSPIQTSQFLPVSAQITPWACSCTCVYFYLASPRGRINFCSVLSSRQILFWWISCAAQLGRCQQEAFIFDAPDILLVCLSGLGDRQRRKLPTCAIFATAKRGVDKKLIYVCIQVDCFAWLVLF